MSREKSGADDGDGGYISTDEDEDAAEKWEPMPLGNQNNRVLEAISTRRQSNDIISTLINVYGSQDAFIKVYRVMLD
jgi:hypothetical protein